MADGRDPRGRFARGGPGGPGRSRRAEEDLWLSRWKPRMPELCDRVMDLALEGNTTAMKIVFDRLLPAPSLQVEELEREIERLWEAATARSRHAA